MLFFSAVRLHEVISEETVHYFVFDLYVLHVRVCYLNLMNFVS